MANFFDILRQTLGQQQGLMQQVPSGNPLEPFVSGGNGGGIVATPEQIAESEAIARQLGIPVDTPALPPEGVYEQGIDVNANRPLPQAPVPVGSPLPVDQSKYLLESVAPDLSNSDWAVAANKAREENDKQVQHKGMFGMKGTLREVLGVIGDSFLVQGGADRVYAPQRQREREGDAMAGMTQAPRAAVERMTAVNPELARQLGNDVATQEVAQMNAERMAEKEAAARRAKGIDMLSRAAGGVNNETYLTSGDRKGMKEVMQSIVDSYGLGEEYNLPDTYDENWLRSIQWSGMPAASQVSAGQRDRGLDQGDRRLDQAERGLGIRAAAQQETARANRARERIAEIRANKPSGGSGPNPTAASIAQPLLQKVINGGTLTPKENEALERTGFGLDRGSSGGRGSSRPSQNNRTPIRVLGKRPAN